MSIPVDRLRPLEESERRLEDRILEFLRQTPQQAFNLMEIFAGVEGFADVDVATDFLVNRDDVEQERIVSRYRDALAYLILEQLVRSGAYLGDGYYAASA